MTTHWDSIYQHYQQGGEAWATLAEEIHPLFLPFLERTQFPVKQALDIGCGTGKYLQMLAGRGFGVTGIDTSETALQMTKDLVPGAEVVLADMYDWPIPAGRYDVILSVSTIHHGTKDQVAGTIQHIHEALLPGGSIFITIPDWDHAKAKQTPETHETIAPGVSAPLTGPEKGLAHSFYAEAEARQAFAAFANLRLELDLYHRWVITGAKT